MRKLAILVIATVLATAYAGAGASERPHHKHPAKAARAAPGEPATPPATRLPVPADTFRA
jgi:hypothetical protein